MKINVNPKTTRMCAFCAHYHDPCRSGAVPKPGSIFYIVDSDVRCPCTIMNNMLRPANSQCAKFKRR